MKPKHDKPINFVIRVDSDYLIDVYPMDEAASTYCRYMWLSERDEHNVLCYPLLAWNGILGLTLAQIDAAGMRAYVYSVDGGRCN